MRIGCANIRNYPDMAPAQVRADARTMAVVAQVWGQQESDPNEDYPVIRDELGKDWAGVHGVTNVPIYYLRDVFTVVDKRRTKAPFDPTLPLVPRPRWVTGVTLRLKSRTSVPPFALVNVHYLAGGYNGPQQPMRRRQWDVEYDVVASFVKDYRDEGLTTFVLGDFNHPRAPKPVTRFTWLVGERLDRIGVTTTGGVEVDEVEDGVVRLNSDHNGQWTRVLLEGR